MISDVELHHGGHPEPIELQLSDTVQLLSQIGSFGSETDNMNIGEPQPKEVDYGRALSMIGFALLVVFALLFLGMSTLWCRRQYQKY